MKILPFILAAGITALFLINNAQSDNWGLVELKEVTFDFKNYFDGGRDPLLTQNGLQRKGMGKYFGLDFNNTLFWGLMYWDNTIHGQTDKDLDSSGGQFRTVGWKWRTGFNVTDFLQVGYFHHSQHVIDTEYKPGFPVQDAVELKINIFKAKP